MNIFVNEEYKDFKYLVNVSDNYIVLTNQKNIYADWQNPETYDIIYQYLIPSTLIIESEQTATNNRTFNQINTSQNFWDRGDAPIITISGFIMLYFLIFIINGITKLVRKGGVFFGN